jgi:hypothetical protein
MLDGPQSRSGQGGEEKNSQPLLVLEHPIIQIVAQRYTTELFRPLLEITFRCNSLETRQMGKYFEWN